MASKKRPAPFNLSVELLKQIRDNIAQTNVRLEAMAQTTHARFDMVDRRIAQVHERLVEVDLRLASELMEVAKAVQQTNVLVQRMLYDRDALNDLTERIAALEKKAG